MTLSTTLFIDTPIDTDSLFDFSLLLCTPPQFNQPLDILSFDEKKTRASVLSSSSEQKLNASVKLRYRKDGTELATENIFHTDYYNHDYDENFVEIFEDTYIKQRACFAELQFETPYGFVDSTKRSVEELHRDVILTLGEYLNKRHVEFRWTNEFCTDLNSGLDGVDDFVKCYNDAKVWFNSLYETIYV